MLFQKKTLLVALLLSVTSSVSAEGLVYDNFGRNVTDNSQEWVLTPYIDHVAYAAFKQNKSLVLDLRFLPPTAAGGGEGSGGPGGDSGDTDGDSGDTGGGSAGGDSGDGDSGDGDGDSGDGDSGDGGNGNGGPGAGAGPGAGPGPGGGGSGGGGHGH